MQIPNFFGFDINIYQSMTPIPETYLSQVIQGLPFATLTLKTQLISGYQTRIHSSAVLLGISFLQ